MDEYKEDRTAVIYLLLKEVGIPAHLRGYDFVFYAIECAIDNPERPMTGKNGMYADIAQKYGSTATRVERAIRVASEYMCLHSDIDDLRRVFGNTLPCDKDKPINRTLIYQLAKETEMRLKKVV